MGQHHFGAGRPAVTIQKISAEIAANGQAVTGNCVFGGMLIKTDGTNNVTVSAYNGTSNAGSKLFPAATVIPAASRMASITYNPGLSCPDGIYVEISGTGGVCQVLYDN